MNSYHCVIHLSVCLSLSLFPSVKQPFYYISFAQSCSVARCMSSIRISRVVSHFRAACSIFGMINYVCMVFCSVPLISRSSAIGWRRLSKYKYFSSIWNEYDDIFWLEFIIVVISLYFCNVCNSFIRPLLLAWFFGCVHDNPWAYLTYCFNCIGICTWNIIYLVHSFSGAFRWVCSCIHELLYRWHMISFLSASICPFLFLFSFWRLNSFQQFATVFHNTKI